MENLNSVDLNVNMKKRSRDESTKIDLLSNADVGGFSKPTFLFLNQGDSDDDDVDTKDVTKDICQYFHNYDFMNAMKMNALFNKHMYLLTNQIYENRRLYLSSFDNKTPIERLNILNRKLTFEAKNHIYKYNDLIVSSVTQFLDIFFKFDADATIDRMMSGKGWKRSFYYNKFGKEIFGGAEPVKCKAAAEKIKRKILKYWDDLALAGTSVHCAIEKHEEMREYLENKKMTEDAVAVDDEICVVTEDAKVSTIESNDENVSLENLSVYNFLEPQYSKLDTVLDRRVCLSGYEQFDEYRKIMGWKILNLETKIYNPELNIAGCVDAIYQVDSVNRPFDVVIVDWKTCTISPQGFLSYEADSIFQGYPKTNYIKYSMQLSLYAKSLELIGFNVVGLYIVSLKHYIGINGNVKNDDDDDDETKKGNVMVDKDENSINILSRFLKKIFYQITQSKIVSNSLNGLIKSLENDKTYNECKSVDDKVGILEDVCRKENCNEFYNVVVNRDNVYTFKIFDAIYFNHLYDLILWNVMSNKNSIESNLCGGLL